MITVVETSYLIEIENHILKHAPYQKVLFVYDLTADMLVVDNIYNRLKNQCVLTKYFLQNEDRDDRLAELLITDDFRVAIIYAARPQNFAPHNLIIPTSCCLLVPNSNSEFLICPQLINDSAQMQAYLSLSSLCVELIESMFTSCLENDTQSASNIYRLICHIINFFTNSICIDNTTFILSYYQIIQTINKKQMIQNIRKININNYFLSDFLVIFNIFLFIFYDNKNILPIFDIYKIAKNKRKYSDNYFHFINYFYALYLNTNIRQTLSKYKAQFISTLTSLTKAINYVDFTHHTANASHSLALAEDLVSGDIENDRPTLLAYAKLHNIF